jgi:Thioredoxin
MAATSSDDAVPQAAAAETASDRPQLIFFYSPTSGSSRRTEGFLAQVLRRRRNHQAFQLRRIDADQHPQLVERFEIDAIPTLVVVDNRRVRAPQFAAWLRADLRDLGAVAELNGSLSASKAASAAHDGSVLAAAEPLSQFRCVACGYGASCKIAPERCPMCGGGSWEYQERRYGDGCEVFSMSPPNEQGGCDAQQELERQDATPCFCRLN